jgi:Flp pilus assembly protein TadG
MREWGFLRRRYNRFANLLERRSGIPREGNGFWNRQADRSLAHASDTLLAQYGKHLHFFQFGGDALKMRSAQHRGGTSSGAEGKQKGRSMKRRVEKSGAGIGKLFRGARQEQGSALIEFAFVFCLLITLLFGMFYIGFTLYAYHFTSFAAEQGARYTMVRGYTWSKYVSQPCSSSATGYNCTAAASDIQTYVQSLAQPGIKASGITIDETTTDLWPGQDPNGNNTGCTVVANSTNINSPGCMVKVKVIYTFNAVPKASGKTFEVILGWTSMTMTATSETVIEE